MRSMIAIFVLVAAGCAPKPRESASPPPPAKATRWGFGVEDLARVEALSGAGRVRLPVPRQLWGEIVAALDSETEGQEPGPVGPRSPVLRFELKRGGELTLDLVGREHWRLTRGETETPLAPCPALKAVCGVALRLACAAGADEIVVAKVTDGSSLEVVRTLKGSATGRLRVEGGPLPSPGSQALCLAFLRTESDVWGAPRYHRLLPVGTLWDQTEDMEAKVRECIPLPEKWGEAVGGLRLGLRARESEVEAGGEVAIEVCIQNVGKEPVRLLQHRLNIYDYYPHTRFVATLPDGTKRELAKPITHMNESDTLLLRTLQPGEAYIHTVRLNDWWDLTVPPRDPDNFTQPGLHRIACTYSVKAGEDSKGCWAGTLTSPPIQIRVRPASKVPGEFI